MKKIYFVILFFLSTFHSFSSDTTNVLFIGNSITYFNDMPAIFQEVSNSKGNPVTYTMYAPGGSSFASHSSNPLVYSFFAEGDWDYIILQPNTNEAIGGTIPINETIEFCQQLVDSAYKYNPCTKIMLFENSTGIWSASPSDSIIYLEEQAMIRSNFLSMSDSVKCPIIPIGEGYKLSRQADPSLFLWISYADIHPNPEGSYLDACILYSSIFQSSVIGASSSPILPATADYLQAIADSIVLDSLSTWQINAWNQTTDFDYTSLDGTVNFSNLSTNFDSLLWDFGDSEFSTDLNPSHEYDASDLYYITLTTYAHGCAQTHVDSININLSTITEWEDYSSITPYPNPTTGILYLENLTGEAKLYDMTGKLQDVYEIKNGSINLSSHQNGIYLLQVVSKKDSFTLQIIKK